MNVLPVLLLIVLSKSAVIRKNDTLEMLREDVSEVGNAVENFAFDVLREVLDLGEGDSTETTTQTSRRRRRRSFEEDDVREPCHKRCETTDAQHIRELKAEVKKLQDMVKLLQKQRKIIDILDERGGNETEAEGRSDNGEELAKMKRDLKEVIAHLNETRELIDLQKRRGEVLEEELLKQNEEIAKLKMKMATAVFNGTNEKHYHPSLRASGTSTLRKLLKSLSNDDDDDDSEDDHLKFLQLQKQLKKIRRQETLTKELKQLENSIEESSSDNELLRRLIKALRKSELQSRTDDTNINNLEDLQEAIRKLRPKENAGNQFQLMLDKLINQRPSERPQFTSNEMNKKLTTNNDNIPYICVVRNGDRKTPSYNKQFFGATPDYGTPTPQFFPGAGAPQNPHPQGVANGANFEKPIYDQGENGNLNKKYHDDLRQQIDGLQSAIDNMNNPEYLQKPEDKAVIEDLAKQVADLRNIVNNSQGRSKRSLENNDVEESGEEMVKKMGEIVGKFLDRNERSKKSELVEMQDRIDNIKHELDNGNDNTRDAAQFYQPPPLSQIYSNDLNPFDRSVKSVKNDIFAEIVGKILDKILATIPTVLQRLFNFSFQELGKYDYQDYDVQVLFKNLGIFGYLPVILLRLLKGVSAFMNMLRRNSFFKNFLMPVIILGTIAGSVLFLIWWLQPEDLKYGYGSYNFVSHDEGYNSNGYSNSQYEYSPSSYNYPVYNRSYFNK